MKAVWANFEGKGRRQWKAKARRPRVNIHQSPLQTETEGTFIWGWKLPVVHGGSLVT